MMENYSLSDIRAATEGGANYDGFGGGAWWIIILFLFIFGMGGGGILGGGNGALTRAEMQQGFDTQEITRKLDGITNGLCDGFYAQNTTMLTGFENIKSAVSDVRFDAQKNTCDIITAVHAEGEATRNLIQQNELQALRDKVSDLQLAQSQCAQNAYLINQLRPCAVPAYLTCSPYASCNGCSNI